MGSGIGWLMNGGWDGRGSAAQRMESEISDYDSLAWRSSCVRSECAPARRLLSRSYNGGSTQFKVETCRILIPITIQHS
jgi:hypothetical protein